MSVNKNDSGYHKRACWFKVLLDRQSLSNCVTADEDRGYAIIHKKDKTGIIIKKIFGKIEIVEEK